VIGETYQVNSTADAWCRSKVVIKADELYAFAPPECVETKNFYVLYGNTAGNKGVDGKADHKCYYFLCEYP